MSPTLAVIVVGQFLWNLFIVWQLEAGAAVPTSVPNLLSALPTSVPNPLSALPSPLQAATLPLEVPLGVHDLPRAPRARPRNPIMERHYEMTRLVFIPHLPGPVKCQASRYKYMTGAWAMDWDTSWDRP